MAAHDKEGVIALPRSKERGLIEAQQALPKRSVGLVLPRSKERGLIEAGYNGHIHAKCKTAFRARKSAASLKPTCLASGGRYDLAFRARKSAASLKRGQKDDCLLDHSPFRARKSAASLKRR